jgi:uncharacterized membrane protein
MGGALWGVLIVLELDPVLGSSLWPAVGMAVGVAAGAWLFVRASSGSG